jgi:hypothetical protein
MRLKKSKKISKIESVGTVRKVTIEKRGAWFNTKYSVEKDKYQNVTTMEIHFDHSYSGVKVKPEESADTSVQIKN